MKALITASGQYGPFTSITQSADRWICDGVEYQFGVIGDATIGEWVEPPAPLPTVDEYTQALTNMLDKEAQTHRYDDRISCALRAGYAGPFHAEGVAFASWMDAQNSKAYQIMKDVQSGLKTQPTMDEFLLMFDPMIWPS